MIAVAITLLVLDLHVPQSTTHTLAHDLLEQWPTYAAYLLSFLTIVLIPFATSMMSSYLKRSQGQHLAAGVYGATLLAMAITFSLLQRQILLRRPNLLREPIAEAERRRIFRRAASGVVPYILATALAVLTPYATLIASGMLAAFYATPLASSA